MLTWVPFSFYYSWDSKQSMFLYSLPDHLLCFRASCYLLFKFFLFWTTCLFLILSPDYLDLSSVSLPFGQFVLFLDRLPVWTLFPCFPCLVFLTWTQCFFINYCPTVSVPVCPALAYYLPKPTSWLQYHIIHFS